MIARYGLFILASFILCGCAAEMHTAEMPTQTVPKIVQVDILKFKFIPADVTINRGDTIVWVNKEKRQYHSVWFEQLAEPEPDYLFPEESYRRKFEEAGQFPYRCGPHPEMIGSITVK